MSHKELNGSTKLFIIIGSIVLALWITLSLSLFVYMLPKMKNAWNISVPHLTDEHAESVINLISETQLKEKVSELEKELLILRDENDRLKEDLKNQENLEVGQTAPSGPPTKTTVTTTTTVTTPKVSCTNYKIYDGDFKSDKCYTSKDYNDLVYYISQYNMATFEYNSAKNTSEITCDGSDFFKKSCEESKERMDDAKDKIGEYKSKIKTIISRGK